MMISRRERTLLRIMSSLFLLVTLLMLLAGCAQIEEATGGQLFNAQVGVGNLTIGVSGHIPLHKAPPPPDPGGSPPAN